MKILIYDVDCSSSGIEYPLKSAFEDLGHDADMFDWTKFLYTSNNINLINRVKDKFFTRFIVQEINSQLIKAINSKTYDLMLVLRGEHILPDTLLQAKKRIKVIANWNTDDLFNKLNSSDRLIKSIPIYDVHFSPRPHLLDEYLLHGAKRFETLNWYYRYGLKYETPLFNPDLFIYDGSFIGSMSNRRYDLLKILHDYNVGLYGWGWNKISKIANQKNWSINPSTDIIQMHKIFSLSKININILTVENRDTSNFRNFEINAGGGFQLSERSDVIENLFKEDEEIVCFSSTDELKSKFDFYSKNDTIRNRIAMSGYKKIFKANNSLTDRLNQIINIIEEIR
jgi:spore maturation protein CgeB